MALRIANNIAAMNTQRWLGVADTGMKKSLERLSSGYRINRAADDAAGLAISQGFRADIASFKVASRNTSEANSLLAVAEGSMDQIGNMLTRLKELATQAASANSGSNLDKIDAEKAELVNEIQRIADVTEYAGTKLINGSFGTASSDWENAAAGATTTLDTTNGLKYVHTDNSADTPDNVHLTFNNSIAVKAEIYSLNTAGIGGSKVELVGGTSGETYIGAVAAGGTTITFDTMGLTMTFDTAINADGSEIDDDTITVTDTKFASMTVSASTTTGTWTIAANVGNDTLTLSNAGESQTVGYAEGSASAQSINFSQLGITLNLAADFGDTEAGELNTMTFDVSGSGSASFQVGASNTANDQINISIGDATTGATGLNLEGMSLASASGAQNALDTIDAAINSLASLRGSIGANQNRLSYAAANLASTIENVQAAESVIRDVDMASEMTDFTKNQILLQAGTAMLAQANMAPQQVLSLFG